MLSARLRGWMSDLRAALWLLPAAAVISAMILAAVLVDVELPGWMPAALAFGGTPDGARSVLSELTGATFTVTALVFSLTVVALQMAAVQFTPRLLRTSLADRRTQAVLAVMLASGVYHVSVLRTVRSTGDDVDLFVPEIAVSVALLLGVIALGLLVFFLHHVTRQLRVDLVMDDIAAETLHQLDRLDAARDRLPDRVAPPPPPAAHARRIVAARSGYLQTADVDELRDVAATAGVRIRLRPQLGEAVSRGTTLGWYWADESGPAPTAGHDRLTARVHGTLPLGPDRTGSRDLTFGLQQLADHPLGADLREDPDGQARAAVPRPTFAQHLTLATAPIRRHSREEPDVLAGLARLLTDLAEHVADDASRAAVVRGELELLARSEIDDPVGAAALSGAIAAGLDALADGGRPPLGADQGG